MPARSPHVAFECLAIPSLSLRYVIFWASDDSQRFSFRPRCRRFAPPTLRRVRLPAAFRGGCSDACTLTTRSLRVPGHSFPLLAVCDLLGVGQLATIQLPSSLSSVCSPHIAPSSPSCSIPRRVFGCLHAHHT